MISNDIKYVGVNDRNIDLFEGQFDVPNGMAYNSYVIIDEKIAVLDTVEYSFGEEWLSNVKTALSGRTPDYLIVQHMEPDHSANILTFAKEYPDAIIVASRQAFLMMNNYFETDFSDRRIIVRQDDVLSLGKHELKFFTAALVHWPEVIMTYDSFDKVLFSADAFGKFGTLDTEEDWACEARRYYFGIVGKFGVQVQSVLGKLADTEIKTICPLHGPVLSENLEYYLNLYNIWSSYGVESEGVMIAYTSVYGNTKKAVLLLAEEIERLGQKVVVNDLARSDMHEAIEDAFRYGKIVLATTTYNGEIFPFMNEFIEALLERNYQSRKIGLIENGSWSPLAAKVIKKKLENSKDITFTETTVKILSAVKNENLEQIKALAKELCE